MAAAETAAEGRPELVEHGGDSAGAVGPGVVDRQALAGGGGATATRSGSPQAAMSLDGPQLGLTVGVLCGSQRFA